MTNADHEPLAEKVAIVTGATKAMGAAISLRLAALGAAIACVGRDVAGGQAVAQQITESGGKAVFIQADVGDEASVTQAAERTAAELGPADIVVNNAAAVDLIRSGVARPIVDEETASFDRVLKVGVYGPFWLARATLPAMMEKGEGCFVHISSTAGHHPTPGQTAYGTSKGALEALSRQIAADYGNYGIRSNVVVVGAVPVEANKALYENNEARRRILESALIPRLGTTSDIAAAVAFLSTPDSSYITGAILPVEGGHLIKKNIYNPARIYRESAAGKM
jgi:meso-butanediol dehydrogenase / (S,S)-butanediol dehydrogenase / diacetyl reductase